MSPETFANLRRVVLMLVLGFCVGQSDFSAPLATITLGDLQALVLLAGLVAGYK